VEKGCVPNYNVKRDSVKELKKAKEDMKGNFGVRKSLGKMVWRRRFVTGQVTDQGRPSTNNRLHKLFLA